MTVFELLFYDDNFRISKNDLIISESIEKQLSIDCKLKIIINGRIFYDDWIYPLELYYEYLKWNESFQKGEHTNFQYNTVDNYENPLFEFLFDEDIKQWKIDGKFKNYEEKSYFSDEEIVNFFEQFIQLISTHIC